MENKISKALNQRDINSNNLSEAAAVVSKDKGFLYAVREFMTRDDALPLLGRDTTNESSGLQGENKLASREHSDSLEGDPSVENFIQCNDNTEAHRHRIALPIGGPRKLDLRAENEGWWALAAFITFVILGWVLFGILGGVALLAGSTLAGAAKAGAIGAIIGVVLLFLLSAISR